MEISDKALVITLIIAITVAVGGVAAILGKLGSAGAFGITGFASSNFAVVNASVTSTIAITLPVSTVNFGSSSITGDSAYNINTSSSTLVGSFTVQGPIQVQNDGNQYVNLSINGTTAAAFLGGSSPTFSVNITDQEAGSCKFLPITAPSDTNASVSGTVTLICGNLKHHSGDDLINVSVFLGIPADSLTGQRNAVITFSAATNS